MDMHELRELTGGEKKVPEDRMLKHAAAASIFLMVCVLLIPIGLQNQKGQAIQTGVFPMLPTTVTTLFSMREQKNFDYLLLQGENGQKSDLYQKLPGTISDDLKKRLGDNFIVIEKPKFHSDSAMISLQEEAVDRCIKISITDSFVTNIEKNQIHRIYQGKYYQGEPRSSTPIETPMPETKESSEQLVESQPLTSASTGSEKEERWESDCLQELQVSSCTFSGNGCFTTEVMMKFDKTYAYLLFEDDHNYYISLVRPKDVYDKIVVVDAGHGGNDSGTYSRDYAYHEKDMNLSMVLELKDLLEQEDIKVYYTRTTDQRLTLNQRVNLANDVEADFFVSIHCNANDVQGVHGTEVLYNEKQNDWTTMNSKRFASICLREVVEEIGLDERGLVPRSKDVHIVGESKVPVALIEVAFMSNQGDLSFLTSKEGKQRVAKGVYDAILSAYEELQQEQQKEQMAVKGQ